MLYTFSWLTAFSKLSSKTIKSCLDKQSNSTSKWSEDSPNNKLEVWEGEHTNSQQDCQPSLHNRNKHVLHSQPDSPVPATDASQETLQTTTVMFSVNG